ncbi:hypothetical protein FDB03_08655 [Clostridium botulinum]|nr:hypothetical protein [Clostridium botulinum]NFQ99094.1 hypothetical protein [Clostridium botulinum]NFU58382.1 hypothetical protein [Clostridium botulinum]
MSVTKHPSVAETSFLYSFPITYPPTVGRILLDKEQLLKTPVCITSVRIPLYKLGIKSCEFN